MSISKAYLAVALPLCLPATGPQDPVRTPATGGFVLDKGEHTAAHLIDTAAAFLGRNYLIDPTYQDTATILVQKRLELDALGCEEVLSQLLYTRQLVLTPVDPTRGIWEWIGAQGPMRNEISMRTTAMTPEEIGRRPGLKIHVTTAVPLEHIRASAASQALRPFFAQSGRSMGPGLNVGQLGDDTLLVAGMMDSVAVALELLERADRPGKEPEPTLVERVGALEQRVASLEKSGK